LRSSSKTNFEVWRPLENINYLAKKEIYEDKVAEAGVAYRYKIITSDAKWIMTENTQCVLMYEDYYLESSKYQVRIRYNPEVGNISFNTQDSVQNVLGSKYPIVTRNGLTRYRTFTIGGLLSFNAENEDLINNEIKDSLKRENKIIDTVKNEDSLFINTHYIKDYNSDYYQSQSETNKQWIQEKIYRDKIIEFLHEDSVKLFKSFTEGNILIKLQ
jgi:hypothetical protein